MNDVLKWWLKSRWMVLSLGIEGLAQAYEHIAEIRDVLPDDLYKWLAFGLPILLAILRMQSASQQPLTMTRPENLGSTP